ncbi:MAG: cytochrome P460 family protein [Alphaproteobacteria bacterium]
MQPLRATAVLATVLLLSGSQIGLGQGTEPDFGGPADVAFALRLWDQLQEARMVGTNAIGSRPYEGVEPHGAILTTLQSTLAIDDREGTVIVKNNYLGENVSVQSVADNPRLNLDAITVMFRREAGYDPATRNWFWAKFKSDGTLSTNPRGVSLAGLVAKNPEDGCIACHRFAPGNDYVFLNDQFAVPEAFADTFDEPPGALNFTPARLDQQPAETALSPGLQVTYYNNIFNFVQEVREWAQLVAGEAGAPLLSLDYSVGSGRVLSSDRRDGVGAAIEGLINFPIAGTYSMAVKSNDGVELNIGGETIFSDPTVHADRFSDLVTVEIDQPGWYALNLLYFEKRNTSTLELYWLLPEEEGGLNFVPPSAFAHRSG